MNIKIIPIYKYLDKYLDNLRQNPKDAETLWDEFAIKPFWNKLCQYEPFDLSDRKPHYISDADSLQKQIEILNKLDLDKLQEKFNEIASTLPNYDDDPLTIAIYPLDEKNTMINEKQNGVIGCSLFGNNIISVNPLVDGYEAWISYVFAHEYHHTVWGNYWFVLHNNELTNQFITSLLIDGEADSFALSFCPSLKPKWLFDLSTEKIQSLWNNFYLDLSLKEDVDYNKYMFGDDEIPWCAGYAVGYWLFQKYLSKNSSKTFKEIVEIKPDEILKETF